MPPYPLTGNAGEGLTRVPPPQLPTRPRPRPGIEEEIREAVTVGQHLPAPARADVLSERLLAYIRVTAAAVEAAVGGRPAGDPVREDALAVVREARARLGLTAGDGYVSAIIRIRSLGRGAEALLEQQQLLRITTAETSVAVPHASDAGVIAIGAAETCTTCHELVEKRRESQARNDWAASREANGRLEEHRHADHAPA
ncbi:DUF6415 family natural product biosynthesis protein [Streptomyces sp. UNOB3_S3]|uniref:DUF6415 family natural product biosynthesis protein n=1 Tax=Streptomyces sp. UNOB3_S3 TaxID=2871682 RepID=UPI001E2A901B|nr:DUF6415 family natural product biosynthesis protein [Streptomyces sp. UNOB3_S3]MCC3776709.1 hypothetical protein [Streptomyces sp. UNOB3_S3]